MRVLLVTNFLKSERKNMQSLGRGGKRRHRQPAPSERDWMQEELATAWLICEGERVKVAGKEGAAIGREKQVRVTQAIQGDGHKGG